MPSPVKSKISPQTNKEAKWAPFSLRVGVVPGAVGDIPASIPGVHFLEEVTSHEVGIAAILVGGILVVQEARVGLIIDTKTLKALLQPVVLAALLAQVHLALPTPGKQNFDGLRGQGFQRTEELELVEGVPEIDRSALRRTQGVLDLAPEMVGEKDSIWVHFNRPIVVFPTTILLNHLPRVDEGLNVAHAATVLLANSASEFIQPSAGPRFHITTEKQ